MTFIRRPNVHLVLGSIILIAGLNLVAFGVSIGPHPWVGVIEVAVGGYLIVWQSRNWRSV